MNYSLIIPIYNEERTLIKLIDKLSNLNNKQLEVIIIDDGSNDGTKRILDQYNDEFVISLNKFNIGKGASIIKGAKLASHENIILIDGDLEVDINDIPELILKYETQKSDVIAGVRWINKNPRKDYDINSIGNFIINYLFNLLYKSNFNDILCCIKILSLKNFESLKIQSQGFSIEAETMAKLVLNGFTIDEQLVKYNRRTAQEGKKLKFSDGWKIIWAMLKLRFLNH